MCPFPTKIAVLTHVNENFETRPYLLRFLVEEWRSAGTDVRILRGTEHFEPADALILHTDLTVVPEPYLEFCWRYPVVINGGVRDISKRRISSNLVERMNSYRGSVIVKTNRNFGGSPERRITQRGFLERIIDRAKRRLPWSLTGYLNPHEYPIFPTTRDVPRVVWRNPNLVVEKFSPEREGTNYCLRQWVFFGNREISLRSFSPHPIVKATNTLRREYGLPVPEELRALRTKFQFDYGKFDYAFVNGKTALYDVNHTPTVSWSVLTEKQISIINELAQGLGSFC